MKKKSQGKQTTTKATSAKTTKKAPRVAAKSPRKASAAVKKSAAKKGGTTSSTPSRAKAVKATSKKAKANVPSGERPLLDRIAFTLLQVEDATRARAFYEEQLGLVRGLASPDGTWTEYDLPGGGCLALFQHPAGTFEPSGGACVAFEVTDVEALNERLRAAGVRYQGEMVKGPHCRMWNILDTEGNGIILHQLDSYLSS